MNKTHLILFFFVLNICLAQKEIKQCDLSFSALELTNHKVTYDPSYFSIEYPDGDILTNKGVCTDVVIRAYRKLGKNL